MPTLALVAQLGGTEAIRMSTKACTVSKQFTGSFRKTKHPSTIRPVGHMFDIQVHCPPSPSFRTSHWLIAQLTMRPMPSRPKLSVSYGFPPFLLFFPLPSEFAETERIYYDALNQANNDLEILVLNPWLS